MPQPDIKFGILGAGSIGCYIGAHLARAGLPTVLVGRPTLGEEVAVHGLHVSGLGGRAFHVPPTSLQYATSPESLLDCDVVLVTVKSRDTQSAARSLTGLQAGATVISFQNGVGNADVLRSELPDHLILAGMVPYNVVRSPGARFHCGTSGTLLFERQAAGAEEIATTLTAAGLEAKTHGDMPGVLWGKLIFNLNNAINALAGVPLREELSQRRYRRIVAASMREALGILKAAGIRARAAGKMIPGLAPLILGLPDSLFFRVASPMVKIDPEARSSMWEDLTRGRPTEIDYISGEIVRLAERHGRAAPIARRIVELIHDAERAGAGSPGLSAVALAQRLGI